MFTSYTVTWMTEQSFIQFTEVKCHLESDRCRIQRLYFYPDHNCLVPTSLTATTSSALVKLTCEPAGFGQQKSTPGHEEEEGSLQQRKTVQLGELGDVRGELKNKSDQRNKLLSIWLYINNVIYYYSYIMHQRRIWEQWRLLWLRPLQRSRWKYQGKSPLT